MFDKLRKKCGFTQREIENKLNLKNGTVSKWERGKTKPKIETLPLIAKIMKTSVEIIIDALIKGKQDENESETTQI